MPLQQVPIQENTPMVPALAGPTLSSNLVLLRKPKSSSKVATRRTQNLEYIHRRAKEEA